MWISSTERPWLKEVADVADCFRFGCLKLGMPWCPTKGQGWLGKWWFFHHSLGISQIWTHPFIGIQLPLDHYWYSTTIMESDDFYHLDTPIYWKGLVSSTTILDHSIACVGYREAPKIGCLEANGKVRRVFWYSKKNHEKPVFPIRNTGFSWDMFFYQWIIHWIFHCQVRFPGNLKAEPNLLHSSYIKCHKEQLENSRLKKLKSTFLKTSASWAMQSHLEMHGDSTYPRETWPLQENRDGWDSLLAQALVALHALCRIFCYLAP